MHIVFFSDHHPDSLGGVQTSLLLQKKYLEKLGHKVTVVASRRYRRRRNPEFIEVPALPLPPTGAYSIQPSLHLAFRKAERALAELAEPVDLVHIQADMWQAILGAKWAIDHDIPLVWTVHTNLQVGFQHNVGKLGRRTVAQVMNLWASTFLNQPMPEKTNSLWAFQQQIARHANFVASPSGHFNRELIKHGVTEQPLMFPNGVDDEVAEGVTHQWADASTRKIKLIWAGRFSSEKRISEFLGAFALADLENVELDIYGSGQLEAKIRLLIRQLGIHKTAHLKGRLPHKQLVATFATADAVCQTSIGFETQGMTVYEAISVGTPVFVVDPMIAGELPSANVWLSKKPEVDSMAKGLRAMVADIRAGNAKRADDTGDWTVLQSKLTDRWLKVYAEAIKQGPKRLNAKG
jgi:glycosyltransferase involved in cell wall biosynthesis